MKNTFLKTAAGLFAAILLGAFVLSCEGPAGSNGSSGTIIPQVTAIAQAGAYYAVGYDTVRLVGSSAYTVASNDSIPDGKTLLVAAGLEVVVNSNTLTLGENATLQLEDGAHLVFPNTIASTAPAVTTSTRVIFGTGAKIAGSDGAASLTAGDNGGELQVTELFDASLTDTAFADVSLWSAAGKIAFAKGLKNGGLLVVSKSVTDGEEAGEAVVDITASNGLAIAEGAVAITPSGIVAEGLLVAPSGMLAKTTINDIFGLATEADPEVVITGLGYSGTDVQVFTYANATLAEGRTVYVPTGSTLVLGNSVTLDATLAEPDGKIANAVTYDIKGDIKVSGSVYIGGVEPKDAVGSSAVLSVATEAGGANFGGVTVKGTGSIELVKDANGTQLGKIEVIGANGGKGGATAPVLGGNGGDVVVIVPIDGYVSKVAGGDGGSDNAAGGAVGGASTASGGKGGDVYVNANVNGGVEGGAGAAAIGATTPGVAAGTAGAGGSVYILGDVKGSTVQKATVPTGTEHGVGVSAGSLIGGAAGNHIGGNNGLTVAAEAVPGTVKAAKSAYAVKEDGTGVEPVAEPTDGFEITNAKGTVGSSVDAAASAAGGAGGDVIISGEATYIILP